MSTAFEQVIRIARTELGPIKDLDVMLERVLAETRSLSQADAGSIFLVEGSGLRFAFVQNDSLDDIEQTRNQASYINEVIPVNDKSIAGYAALTGESIRIDDVYELDDKVPYSFNRGFDDRFHYRTRSMMVIPIKAGAKVVGVMQIINALTPDGQVSVFTTEQGLMADLFANEAAIAIERTRLTRTIIMRMIRMAEMRDPKETGAHVNRVGAYAVALYKEWARQNEVPIEEMKRYADTLRLAAMLHDVGKVAIADQILKKPGKLSPEEYSNIQLHTLHGGRLFRDPTSELDSMASEIAMNHHERWDGGGYPGQVENIFTEDAAFGPGKKGEEIPLSGRLVTLADIYDALICKRCYKDAWDENEVLDYIREQSGKTFDPSLVEHFFKIYEEIKIIRQKYPDQS